MVSDNTALLVVDMQRYYLEPDGPFQSYYRARYPGAMDYITERCDSLVIPNIALLLAEWRRLSRPLIFLRLCGSQTDRSDLHPAFRKAHNRALAAGFPNCYPLCTDPYSDISPALKPLEGETVLCKTTYSGYTSSDLDRFIREMMVESLVFTGLATSQCVETTARDAADRGYRIIHVADAQADYEDRIHRCSLYSSQGVCGGLVVTTEDLLSQ